MTPFIIITTCACLLFGCATQRAYSPTSTLADNSDRAINDEAILRAFEAQPQLKLPSRVAWYNMGSDNLPSLSQYIDSQTIIENYNIPKSLVEGLEPLFKSSYYGYRRAPKPINFNAIRLLAARAKCDVVVLCSSRFEERQTWNAWGWLDILILPQLFTPHINAHYKYSAEAFVFDVRNGYMYRHIKHDDEKKINWLTIWTSADSAETANRSMLLDTKKFIISELQTVFSTDENQTITEQDDTGTEPVAEDNTSKIKTDLTIMKPDAQ